MVHQVLSQGLQVYEWHTGNESVLSISPHFQWKWKLNRRAHDPWFYSCNNECSAPIIHSGHHPFSVAMSATDCQSVPSEVVIWIIWDIYSWVTTINSALIMQHTSHLTPFLSVYQPTACHHTSTSTIQHLAMCNNFSLLLFCAVDLPLLLVSCLHIHQYSVLIKWILSLESAVVVLLVLVNLIHQPGVVVIV